MSRVFFDELGLPKPDRDLEVGSDSHARQTGRIMIRFDDLLEGRDPSLVVVVGDVNSTLACSLVAVKRGIRVAHVEAGLRSGDRSMPEEINRIATDSISELLFATSPDAVEHLETEGHPESQIHLVGNPMIDTLRAHLPAARSRRTPQALGLENGSYAVVTLHRPSNVDERARLRNLIQALQELAERLPVIFPVHPRTREQLLGEGLAASGNLTFLEPLGYLEFLGLMDGARFVLTDSGGIQEETTALGVPCLTLRANTERPITILEGTNRLLGEDPGAILPAALRILEGDTPDRRCPVLWDGRAGHRIAAVIARVLGAEASLAEAWA